MLEPGPGASESIYVAAGQERLEGELRLRYPDGCETGKAVITHGYSLPAKNIIHAVCPQWLDGNQGEESFLRSAYTESMKLAEKSKCKSIAFPLLSAGSYRYPRMDAIKVAVNAVMDYLTDHEMDARNACFTKMTPALERKDPAAFSKTHLTFQLRRWSSGRRRCQVLMERCIAK